MTRRERMEQRAEKRREWAAGRRAKAAAVAVEAERYRGDCAFNTQPGHIPERARLIKREERAYEDVKMAAHHIGKATGIERQLDRSVFSDDEDAVECLEARIAENEATAERHKAINQAWRRTKGTAEERAAQLASSGHVGEALAREIARTMELCPWLKQPLDTTNLRASIRRDRARIEDIRRRQDRTEQASVAGGVTIEDLGDGWVSATFVERPERHVLDALKDAGFRWRGGSWAGRREHLPEEVATPARGFRARDPEGVL